MSNRCCRWLGSSPCDPRDARLKLFLTWRTLQFRGRQPELFQSGEYIPLAAEGTRAKHVCAFARRLPAAGPEPPMALVIVPRVDRPVDAARARFSARRRRPWEARCGKTRRLVTETWMPRSLRNLFTGQECTLAEGPLRLGMILADFPVAVLTNV